MEFSLPELTAAADLVHQHLPASPQHFWPQLASATGVQVWVKHENHLPTGAFKVRGGVTLIDWLRREHPDCPGIITATRGNHGQSQARAAKAAGLRAVIYVPRGNSPEKNAAMAAYGAELREAGADFDAAREAALATAKTEGLFFVPPFHRELVRGVATYGLELLTALPDLDAIYAPIGCGSGICGTIAARDALGLQTEIIGVVAQAAPTVSLSVDAGRLVPTNSANTFADGMAVRIPVQAAFDIYSQKASRILAVSEDEIAAAIRLCFETTHNIAEGAGAAALAALWQDRNRMAGKKVAIVLSGGNIDSNWASLVLAGGVPKPR